MVDKNDINKEAELLNMPTRSGKGIGLVVPTLLSDDVVVSDLMMEPWSNEASQYDVLREKLTDVMTPSFQVEFDPDEAERVGAFDEDALSEADAVGSTEDLAESGIVPVFIEDGDGLEIPANVTTENARTLFGKKPGESVKGALERLENQRQGE